MESIQGELDNIIINFKCYRTCYWRWKSLCLSSRNYHRYDQLLTGSITVTVTDTLTLLYLTVGTTTPSQNSNSHLDLEYIHMIVVPLLLILLFFICLGIGVGVAIPCIRLCVSSHRKKKSQEATAKVIASLDTLRRTSVYNLYPANPVSGNVNCRQHWAW